MRAHHPEWVDWVQLSKNESDEAVDWLHDVLTPSRFDDAGVDVTEYPRVCWKRLTQNRNPRMWVFLTTHHPQRVYWNLMSLHAHAFDWLQRYHPDRICLSLLSCNESDAALAWLARPEHNHHVSKGLLSSNKSPAAWRWMQQYPQWIDFMSIAHNTNNDVIHWALQNFPEKIDHEFLACNSCDAAALWIAQQPIDSICWLRWSQNPHPVAVAMIMDPANISRVCWDTVCKNPNPYILAWIVNEHPHRIHWEQISYHPHLFCRRKRRGCSEVVADTDTDTNTEWIEEEWGGGFADENAILPDADVYTLK
jgi:hypothetical protein